MEDLFKLFPGCGSGPMRPVACYPGGEQQMLTICRTLMGDPDLIMVGRAHRGPWRPMLVELVRELLEKIAKRGISILLIEQRLTIAMKISAPAVRDGARAHRLRGDAGRLAANEAVRKEWLEV
jgi:branched-chain amino acid transport system ATP-binding protein